MLAVTVFRILINLMTGSDIFLIVFLTTVENRRNFPVCLASLHKQNHVRVHIIQQFCFTWITSLSCEEPYGERERKSLATVPAEVTTRLFAVKSSTVQNTCTLYSLWCRTHDTTTELSYRGKKKICVKISNWQRYCYQLQVTLITKQEDLGILMFVSLV